MLEIVTLLSVVVTVLCRPEPPANGFGNAFSPLSLNLQAPYDSHAHDAHGMFTQYRYTLSYTKHT